MSLVDKCYDADTDELSNNELLLHNVAASLKQYNVYLTFDQLGEIATLVHNKIEEFDV